MMSEHYVGCSALPTINETFPQFIARPPPQSLQSQQAVSSAGILRRNLILSPLDLSLRAGVNIVPITPPSTPSPPRKRHRFMSDEHYLWRPHVMGTTVTTTTATGHNHFLHTTTYTRNEELNSAHGMNVEAQNTVTTTNTAAVPTARPAAHNSNIDSNKEITNNFEGILKNQRSVSALGVEEYQLPIHHYHQQQPQHYHPHRDLATIYVDNETIVLTEDEDNDDDEKEKNDNDDRERETEENETLLSSQELNEDDETNEPLHKSPQSPQSLGSEHLNSRPQDKSNAEAGEEDEEDEEEEEEEYVDILGNDDDEDVINPLSARTITMLPLQSQADLVKELEESDNVLTRHKLIYENKELHNRAIDGLAKLFDRDFQRREDQSQVNTDKGKTYLDLTTCQTKKNEPTFISITPTKVCDREQPVVISPQLPSTSKSYKTHKTERKRMKLRKHMSLDEETISPVSGTIIRKLRDDEELVVRKGDIDPAFNVVEVTEEAKAILASIDNKIGAYLCQLCRTLYDDAFKLAQHRCPRIVHIEYKCSECEKVFNCPANLASHRRWHKPKSELLANSQSKKRAHAERSTGPASNSPEKVLVDDGIDGIFPCIQCGKTFRRHAYLKKHQASHQMFENLKSLDIFKNTATSTTSVYQPMSSHISNSAATGANRIQSNPLYPALPHPRPYPTRFTGFAFPPPFDQRRFYTLSEFYLTQQLERSSAFQYVQANHLRNLNSATGNFISRPIASSPITPLPPVK